MKDEMENQEPSLFQKAASIAGGILNALKKAFDIRSPSHKMQEITEQLFAGADKPMADAEKKLPAEMARVADGVLSEANRMSEIQSYISGRVSSSGLGAQITGVQKTVSDMQTGSTSTIPAPVNPPKGSTPQQGASNASNSKGEIIIPVYLDGKKIAEAAAPYSDVIQGKRLAFEGRGVGIG
jgi:hypothetical protein